MSDASQWFLVDITLTGTIEAALLDRQRAFLARLTEEGDLVLAAVLAEAKGRGVAVLKAASMEQARAIYARAPVVEAGKANVEINLLRLTAGRLLSA
jgi:uncharacterized protein YciI